MITRRPASSEEVRLALSTGLRGNPDLPVRWLPTAWSKWVPVDSVPKHLRDTITKEQLYTLANEVAAGSSDDLLAGFLIAVQAWGAGIAGQGGDGRGPWRAARALGLPKRSPDAPLEPLRIAAARNAIRLARADPEQCWISLSRGPGHLPGWGESYFTKLMHMAGYSHGSKPWPLILDLRVRDRLGDVGHAVGGGVKGYMTFLKRAHEWAEDWKTTPARVEYALFHRPK